MTYQQLEDLITDKRFQELKFFQEKTNIFTVVGQTHTEHWHSSFMSWLFDPHSSLRLGHFPLMRLLNLYLIKNPDGGITLRDIFSWDIDKIKFCTEKDAGFDGKRRSIDVYGECGDLIVVIENKVNAKENYNNSSVGQTQDYYDYVERCKAPGQRALYFFITADPKQHPYSDKFIQISYQEMYDSIISKCLDHPQVSEDGKYLLEQYAANLRESVYNSNSPMALVHIDICKGLYDDYSETLDEIFAKAERTALLKYSNDPACIIYERYQNVLDEIFLSVDERFGRTPKSVMERKSFSFTELYLGHKIADGMRFSMEYDGVKYYARAVVTSDKRNCYLQVLDENQQPYYNADGAPVGVYESSSSAGVDVINLYRKKHGMTNMIKTLRGTTYWINEDGKSIKQLIDEM